MAEAAEQGAEKEAHPKEGAEAHGAGEGHGEHAAHEEGGSDPLHHIKDVVLWGVDAHTGAVLYKPYTAHGHPKVFDQNGHEIEGAHAPAADSQIEIHAGTLAAVQYAPKKIGPFKLEFTKHMLGVTVIALLLTILLTSAAKRILAHVRSDEAPKGPLANLAEICLQFVRDELVEPIGGHHLTPYTPLFLTYFVFILFSNYLGMIPEFGGVTGNIAITAAMGGSILLIITLLGMYKQGPLGYFLHMVPPGTPGWLWLPLWILEFIGPIIKSFVLCMRLFGNMIAGHLVISNVLGMAVIGKGAMLSAGLGVFMIFVGVPLSLGISVLELLVCFLQAYVFTMLSIIFVGAAVHPEH